MQILLSLLQLTAQLLMKTMEIRLNIMLLMNGFSMKKTKMLILVELYNAIALVKLKTLVCYRQGLNCILSVMVNKKQFVEHSSMLELGPISFTTLFVTLSLVLTMFLELLLLCLFSGLVSLPRLRSFHGSLLVYSIPNFSTLLSCFLW